MEKNSNSKGLGRVALKIILAELAVFAVVVFFMWHGSKLDLALRMMLVFYFWISTCGLLNLILLINLLMYRPRFWGLLCLPVIAIPFLPFPVLQLGLLYIEI